MRRTPVIDVVVLLALLLGQRSVLGLDHGTFTSDEGAYAAQALALADDDRWDVADPFLVEGPDGALTSYVNATVGDDGRVYPYAKQPLWPSVLAVAHDVGGEAGMDVVPLAAALAVPLVAWRLALLLLGGRRSARVAFWAAAVSPAVVVNAHVLWAHGASALTGGLVVLGVVEARRAERAVPAAAWSVLAAAAASVGVLLRAEGLLLAGAVAGALGLGAFVGRRTRRWRLDLVLAIAVGVAGVAGYLTNSAWRDSITGEADALAARGGGDGGSPVGDALSGAFHDLVGDQARSGRFGIMALTVVAACAVVAGVKARRARPDALGFAAVAVGALAVAWAVAPEAPVTGVAAAWPIGAAGLVALRLPDLAMQRLLLVVAGSFAATVFATNYAEGGGLEWGGRFLSPLTVVAAVGAASVVSDLPRARTGQGRVRTATALAVATCLVIAGFATTAMRGTRGPAAEVEAAIATADAPVALTTNEFLPNVLWRTRPSTDWIVVGDGDGGRPLADALAAMDDAGVTRFVSIGIGAGALVAAGAEVESTADGVTVARLPG